MEKIIEKDRFGFLLQKIRKQQFLYNEFTGTTHKKDGCYFSAFTGVINSSILDHKIYREDEIYYEIDCEYEIKNRQYSTVKINRVSLSLNNENVVILNINELINCFFGYLFPCSLTSTEKYFYGEKLENTTDKELESLIIKTLKND